MGSKTGDAVNATLEEDRVHGEPSGRGSFWASGF